MGDDEQETEVAEYEQYIEDPPDDLVIAEDDDDDAEQAMDWADRHPREVAAATGEADDEPVVTTPDFTVDLAAKRVTRDGGDIRLTPTEWQLLEILVRNRGRLVTQRQLLQEVWGPAYESESNYLRVYIAQLRRKLEPEPSRPRYLLTESGMGYRFKA